MLRRSDGEYLLTQEIYDQARKGEPIPPDIDFYDGDSGIHIYRNGGGIAKYYGVNNLDIDTNNNVTDHTIEEIRAMCMPNLQPLPSEAKEGDKVSPSLCEACQLETINKRLDVIEGLVKKIMHRIC